MIVVIAVVIVAVLVIALVGTVIFVCLFYRLRRGGRKPTSHKRHEQGNCNKDNLRPIEQHQQQLYILNDRGREEELSHKETMRSRSLRNDDGYKCYDGFHCGNQVKQKAVNKGDRNLSRLYYKESFPRFDDYCSYTKEHVYPSHTSGYEYRPYYHGDSRGQENRQHSSYSVYSTQQEYIYS
jgi:hypothetical protein